MWKIKSTLREATRSADHNTLFHPQKTEAEQNQNDCNTVHQQHVGSIKLVMNKVYPNLNNQKEKKKVKRQCSFLLFAEDEITYSV